MNCSNIIEHYCLNDDHTKLPFAVNTHLTYCPQCRNVSSKIERSTALVRSIVTEPVPFDDPLLRAVMQKIEAAPYKPKNVGVKQDNAALMQWAIVGIFLIAGFILLPFTRFGYTDITVIGTSFHIAFALLCASCVIAYFSIFIAKNIVFLSKKFGI